MSTKEPKLPPLPEYRPRYPAALARAQKSDRDSMLVVGAGMAGGAAVAAVLVGLGLTTTFILAIGASVGSAVGALLMAKWVR